MKVTDLLVNRIYRFSHKDTDEVVYAIATGYKDGHATMEDIENRRTFPLSQELLDDSHVREIETKTHVTEMLADTELVLSDVSPYLAPGVLALYNPPPVCASRLHAAVLSGGTITPEGKVTFPKYDMERRINLDEVAQLPQNLNESVGEVNDGSNAGTSHYDLPAGATELKHLIWHKNMNAQIGEIFRACYRLGTAGHSSKARDLRKIIAYAEQELERMEKYEK